MTLNQLKQLIERNPLTLPVAKQIGYGAIRSSKQDREEFIATLHDVRRGGASGGFPGFTYTRDTRDFGNKHYREIMNHVLELERETGCQHESEGTYRDSDQDTALNWLSWFALESVAQTALQVEEDNEIPETAPSQIEDRRTEEQKKTHPVLIVARDKFMSGWGLAKGGKSYAAWACRPQDERDTFIWVSNRKEMRNVRITHTLPRIKAGDHLSVYVVDLHHPAYRKTNEEHAQLRKEGEL